MPSIEAGLQQREICVDSIVGVAAVDNSDPVMAEVADTVAAAAGSLGAARFGARFSNRVRFWIYLIQRIGFNYIPCPRTLTQERRLRRS